MLDERVVSAPARKPADPRALNAYRHGLTGQIHILTPADQVAYDQHCRGFHQSFAPVGAVETDLAQAIADDRWRLNRAGGIESSIFALGNAQPVEYTAGNPEVDTAFAQARVWLSEGKNLQLLGLYEHRIQRRVENNVRMLREMQEARQTALKQVVEEVALLTQLAESKGETYDPARDYPRQTLPPQFDFSKPGIARLAAHQSRLVEAKREFPAVAKLLGKAA
ncbi:MAG: hypothetical protein ACLQVN_06980 [Bryobacteraceae bacterium]